MQGLLTSHAAREMDVKIRDKLGLSTLVLMENAGSAVAREVLKSRKSKKKIAVFCGKGNNGGDGFVAARHLLSLGVKPEVFFAGSFPEVKNEAKTNLEVLNKLKQEVFAVNEGNLIEIDIKKYGLIIDALLGVGLAGEPRGVYADLIRLINSSGAEVIAVDIPSGLDATSGKIFGCCVKADKTVTFMARKQGMVMGEGPKYCGKIIVEGLGVGSVLNIN